MHSFAWFGDVPVSLIIIIQAFGLRSCFDQLWQRSRACLASLQVDLTSLPAQLSFDTTKCRHSEPQPPRLVRS